MINSLGAKYTEISSDELKEDILDKYERAIEDGSAELTNIAPLTERIACLAVVLFKLLFRGDMLLH